MAGLQLFLSLLHDLTADKIWNVPALFLPTAHAQSVVRAKCWLQAVGGARSVGGKEEAGSKTAAGEENQQTPPELLEESMSQ